METQKPKAWIGIDPGQNGAAALISEEAMDYFDWPGDSVLAAKEIREWVEDYDITLALIEKVSSRPGNGTVSMFKFGVNCGVWHGILSAFKIPFTLVAPREWQKGLITPTDGIDPKQRSLVVARRLFPGADLCLKKHHGRSDALLMALVARNKM
ncbi:MAG: hypothetical protein KKD44_12035 [Proteobacteria bacterium]|nr:hypothetical protein [Pseudomonadota bacterium]